MGSEALGLFRGHTRVPEATGLTAAGSLGSLWTWLQAAKTRGALLVCPGKALCLVGVSGPAGAGGLHASPAHSSSGEVSVPSKSLSRPKTPGVWTSGHLGRGGQPPQAPGGKLRSSLFWGVGGPAGEARGQAGGRWAGLSQGLGRSTSVPREGQVGRVEPPSYQPALAVSGGKSKGVPGWPSGATSPAAAHQGGETGVRQ